MWSKVLLLPLRPVDEECVSTLASFFSRETPLDVVLGEPLSVEMDEGCQIPGRDLLERLPFRENEVVLGVTGLDVGARGRLYIFGQGAVGHGVALVSTFRLLYAHHGWSPSRELFMERLCKVALHEVGHAMGLDHCHGECVMRVCTSVHQLDRVPLRLCSRCTAKLGWPPWRRSSRAPT